MRRVMKYPIYPITFSYVNGIFFANIFALQSYVPLLNVLSCVCLVVLVFNAFVKYRFYSFNSFLSIYLFGLIFFNLGVQSFYKEKEIFPLQSSQYDTLYIKEELKSNTYYSRYYAAVLSQKSSTILLYVPIDYPSLKVGDLIYDSFTYQKIPLPSDLFVFNYSEYLSNKQIHFQTHLTNSPLIIGSKKDFNYYLTRFREQLLDSYLPYFTNTDDLALVAGLLFGQKLTLSDEIQSAYRNAGVMHVLAVSGMHVMIIYAFLLAIFKRFTNNKKMIFSVIIVVLIVFAFLSGLSGSVVRAVLMSLLFMLGTLLKRPHFTVHSMIVSLLLLLIVYPLFLFDIGFQLSYLAVFSIIFVYPLFQNYFKSKNKIILFLLETMGVSLAAQFGVLFLSVYYFHQFPLWFLLGNLVAVPATSLALILLLIQLPFNFLVPIISSVFSYFISFLVRICNQFLLWINSLSIKVIDHIFIRLEDVFLYTIAFFLLVGFIRFKRIKYVYWILILFIIKSAFNLNKNMLVNEDEVFLVGDKNRFEIITYNKDSVVRYINGEVPTMESKYQVYFSVNKESIIKFDNYLQTKDRFFVLDSSAIYFNKIDYEYLILKDNPKVRLDMISNIDKCKLVVIHPNNSFARRQTWKAYLAQKNIPFHDMREKGYVIIK